MTRAVLVRTVSLLLATIILATSCANGSDSSIEIDAIRADSNAAIMGAQDRAEAAEATAQDSEASLSTAEGTIEDQTTTIGQLTDDLDRADDDIKAKEAIIDTLGDRLDEAGTEITAAERRAIEAEEQVAELRAKYDTELRADAQVAWDQEMSDACAKAGDGTGSIRNFVSHTDELAVIGTKAELVALVTACAEPLRNRSEVEKLNERCERGSVDQVIKGPDELAGSCFVIFVIPWQWDSRTGACNFLGGWDSSNEGTRRFNYDGDGIFRARPTGLHRKAGLHAGQLR